MNTANKLTILRVFMIPVFLLVLYLDVPNANYWALAIFVIASLTDTLDGYIARHYNQTTDFGKFMDPWRTSAWSPPPCCGLWRSARCPPGPCWWSSSGSSACPA